MLGEPTWTEPSSCEGRVTNDNANMLIRANGTCEKAPDWTQQGVKASCENQVGHKATVPGRMVGGAVNTDRCCAHAREKLLGRKKVDDIIAALEDASATSRWKWCRRV